MTPWLARLFVHANRLICYPLGWFVWRWRTRGDLELPDDGPLLLLSNHTSFFDPVWAAFHVSGRRRVAFMASSNLFRNKLIGWYLGALGAFPKLRNVKDKGSMIEMQRRYEDDQVVVIFPEGLRTWDGRNAPVLPGIGRLIKRLDARVIFVKIHTGHLYHPRWAKFPRWVPLEIELSGPHGFEGQDQDEILAAVNEGIRIDHTRVPQGLKFGYKMAEGLPTWLWACPSCFSLDALMADGHHVSCWSCKASWEVTVGQEMLPDLTVPRAHARLVEHFGPQWDPGLLSGDGRILGDHGRKLVAEGEVSFDEEGLRVGEWSIRWPEAVQLSMEVADRLQLRVDDEVLVLQVDGQSPVKWESFMKPHWAKATGRG
ncbi:MAG: 1-acyl-sn-glycerol-3-phosphate acyltransferase [Proteobacteria bacterium]|nr:1-acyl-sn-glycerol-3-phosphate acyltransferase [Pseudomonadota bacterium]